jgi:hypothetical protein
MVNEYLETNDIYEGKDDTQIPLNAVTLVKNIKVKLNDTLCAVVFKDKIVVGSQTFPVSIIADLNDAYKQLS